MISPISPVYFPSLMTELCSNADACCPDNDDFLQVWNAGDTINFQFNSGVTVIPDFEAVIGNNSYSPVSTINTAGDILYDFLIPLSAHSGQTIFIDLRGQLGSFGTSVDMRVLPDDSECCTSVIRYWNDCFSMSVDYTTGIEHEIRVRHGFGIRPTISGNLSRSVTRNSSGFFEFCNSTQDMIKTFSAYFGPLWFHERLRYILGHHNIEINGQAVEIEGAGVNFTNQLNDGCLTASEFVYKPKQAILDVNCC